MSLWAKAQEAESLARGATSEAQQVADEVRSKSLPRIESVERQLAGKIDGATAEMIAWIKGTQATF